jgi:hypothetical protein
VKKGWLFAPNFSSKIAHSFALLTESPQTATPFPRRSSQAVANVPHLQRPLSPSDQHLVYTTMIYHVDSPLFRSFLKTANKKEVGGGGKVAKEPKAKGSDGKYQGE